MSPPTFSLNQSFVDLARDKAKQIAQELQADAVILIIAHSGTEIAVGHAHDEARETEDSIAQILKDAANGFEA